MTREELLYNAWLTELNTRLGRYIVRLIDEAGRHPDDASSFPLEELETSLSEDLTELAKAIAEKAARRSNPQPPLDLATDDTALQAALAYAAMDLPVVPGAVWHEGRFVDPITGEPVTRVALQPADTATTDLAQVREWWDTPTRRGQAVLAVVGPKLGAVSIPLSLTERLVRHPWFTTRPTPVVQIPDLPIAFVLYRPPTPPSLVTDHVRLVDEGTTIPLPPTAVGTDSVGWWTSPEQTGNTLLTGQELADLIHSIEGQQA
ncbi:hypothetical protein [Actinosynnema sp. NPDC023587]|uniref:hypothetical protein n=1 Tax=Actinosynnema sp. NPDC023587 TaxID=3154695 RepID=UPI0033E25E10